MKYLKRLNKMLQKEVLQSPNSSSFRKLTFNESQAVEIYDFRDISVSDPNNNVIITCEHASNVTHSYKFSEEQKKWLDTHWGYDIGAKDIGIELSEESKTLSIFSNFSRLIIDPNRSLLSSTLVRKYVEKNVELECNRDEVLDIDRRIELFYMPYYQIMREVLNFTRPRFAISVHSFTKQYEDNPERPYEVGILFNKKNVIVDKLEQIYKDQGVIYRLNEPYSPQDGVCFAMDSLTTWNMPEWTTETVLLEFRNDYCSNPAWRRKQVKMLSGLINELKTYKH
jgi:predicted N-formylglutamate amidohydrolase